MDTDEAVPASSLAGRYLAVRLERIKLGRRARFRHQAWAFFCGYLLPDVLAGVIFIDGYEPKEPTLVVVTRRSDDAELATFEYDYLLAASDHRYWIAERLETEHIYDVCRQLSIDIMQIGPPVDG